MKHSEQHQPASTDEARALAQTFADGSLDAGGFGHVAHLAVAWCYLVDHPADGISRFEADLGRFVVAAGAADKYHATLTRALLLIMAQRIRHAPPIDWPGFLAANNDLVSDARAVLENHYSPELLASNMARQSYQTPDRLPLPV